MSLEFQRLGIIKPLMCTKLTELSYFKKNLVWMKTLGIQLWIVKIAQLILLNFRQTLHITCQVIILLFGKLVVPEDLPIFAMDIDYICQILQINIQIKSRIFMGICTKRAMCIAANPPNRMANRTIIEVFVKNPIHDKWHYRIH